MGKVLRMNRVLTFLFSPKDSKEIANIPETVV